MASNFFFERASPDSKYHTNVLLAEGLDKEAHLVWLVLGVLLTVLAALLAIDAVPSLLYLNVFGLHLDACGFRIVEALLKLVHVFQHVFGHASFACETRCLRRTWTQFNHVQVVSGLTHRRI